MEKVSLRNQKIKEKRGLMIFFQETFLRKKLNNWFGYMLIIGIGILYGFLLAKHTIVGFGVLGAFIGIFILIIFISNPEFGFYSLIVFSFFAFFSVPVDL